MPISYFADNTGAPRHTDLHNVFWETSSAYHRGISGANRWKETGEMSPEVFGVDPIDTNPNKTLSLLDWANSFPCARNIQPRLLSVNEYFPRIYRPGASAMQSQDVMKQSAVAVQVLCDRLEHLFRVVEPVVANLQTYGHEIRSLLLLACMEVEAALSAVLRANSYPGTRWSTRDYVKLINPMRLDAYEFRLAFYPNIPPIAPFSTWSNPQPTQSLPWYHAYNQTKHDRESHFLDATLKNAIAAVCGAAALFYAQFGWMELGCRAFLSCISKGFGGFCSRLLRLRTGKLSSAFRLHGFANIF